MAEFGVVQVEGRLVKGMPTAVEGVQMFKGIPYEGPVGGGNR
jgi:carboxylesterase type B